MSCFDSCKPTPKCNCCENCIRKQIAKICQEKREMEEEISKIRRQRTRDGSTPNSSDIQRVPREPRDDSSVRLKPSQIPADVRTMNSLRERTQRFFQQLEATGNCTDDEQYEQCERGTVLKESPTRRTAHNIDYKPQSNFLKKMKRLSQESPVSDGPGMSCCAGRRSQSHEDTFEAPASYRCKKQVSGGNRRRASSACQCCKCDHSVQNSSTPSPAANHRMIFREKLTPVSEMSSIHDPCMCYRTWRPTYHGEEYDFEENHDLDFEQDDDYSDAFDDCTPFEYNFMGEGVFDEGCSDSEHPDFDDESQIRPKREKSVHVSRDKRRRRGRRKCVKKTCEESFIDFEPSLKRPHPNSCERCWRYASPSRSPVNKPYQRFDPNYRRSHSHVNITTEHEKGESSDGDSRLIEYDPETKVNELMNEDISRIKSADNVKKPKMARPGRAKCPSAIESSTQEALPSRKDVTRKPTGTPQSKVGSTQTNGVFFDFTQTPVQCSPSMFDKASQRSSAYGKRGLKSSTPRSSSKSSPCQRGMTRSGNRSRPVSSSAYERSSPRSSTFERSTPKTSLTARRTSRSGKTSTADSMTSNKSKKSKERPSSASSPRSNKRELFADASRSGPCYHAKSRLNYQSEPASGGSRFDAMRPSQVYKGPARYGDSVSGGRAGPSCVRDRKSDPNCFKVSGDPSRTPVTLWDRRGSTTKPSSCYGRQSNVEDSSHLERDKEKSAENGRGARKYCVFYMTRGKEPRDEDAIEVFIEEIGENEETCNGTEKKALAARKRMQKMREPKMESMALKFQKGVANNYKRSQEDRILYF